MCTLPSRLLTTLRPMRASTVGILRQRRQVFVLHDRRRHVPGRVDGDELHRLGEQRRRRWPACRRRRGSSRPPCRCASPAACSSGCSASTWALPRSRGIQRQRSILAMMVSITSLRRRGRSRIEAAQRAGADQAVGVHPVGLLVGLDRGGERLVVAQAGRVAGHVEPLAQQRNARRLPCRARSVGPSGMRTTFGSSAVAPRSSASFALSAR